ncbi:gamma-glutamyl-gamma-aminobutyrate hydrolase family protein [Paraferrimonas sp. SM1919]|uniref:gamma-glutamyl-gamma-aminobutyrate hydrolase family protein n=1 Tax=Paraferrimonas sp. SM1919 TaxID=2662263 RepID=UPI0013D62A2E|nr:gamma-glutamyl-gamma-aminobutyrate hydrolase family protein [Paraferrimonas sp. SM1919]
MVQNLPLIIGVCADVVQNGAHAYHQVGDKYIRALTDTNQAMIVVLPALFDLLDESLQEQYIRQLDGLLLTGSYSNLHPSYYGEQAAENDDAQTDPMRDASNWQLIRKATEHNLPILGICRGFQELNAFFGGTLHHRVHEVSGLNDHREDKNAPLAQQYAPAHAVNIHQGGLMSQWFEQPQIEVNSIHMQGVNRLGEPLIVEASASDGLIEAFSHPKLNFLFAVQWHPEWKPEQYPQNKKIINSFIDACHRFHKDMK